jgi:hypothetical protein
MVLVSKGQIAIEANGLTRAQWDTLKVQVDTFLAAHPQLTLLSRTFTELE